MNSTIYIRKSFVKTRSDRSKWRQPIVSITFLASLLLCMGITKAQDAGANATKSLSPKFIPKDAIVFAQATPKALLEHRYSKYLPVEILNAWCEENVGILPESVLEVRLAVPMPTPTGPVFGATIVFASPTDLKSLRPGLIDQNESVDVDGMRCFPVGGEESVVIHPLSPKVWILATPNYLPSIAKAAKDQPNEGIRKIISQIPTEGHFQAVFAIEPIRPIAQALIQQQLQQLPPQFSELRELVGLIESIRTSLDLETLNPLSLYDYSLRANNEADAEKVEQIIHDVMLSARDLWVPQLIDAVEGDDKIAKATRAYIKRMSEEVPKLQLIQRDGRDVQLASGIGSANVANVGVIVGLLLPAVQAAREAARRMTASNHLKQIALALHNYHAVNRQLPTNIASSDGRPLLSWRVAILPFIEQQALYDSFRKDEPWDSPHNLALVESMPETFIDPSSPVRNGQTVFQRPIGPMSPFANPLKPISFREMRDGTANTILVVETRTEDAVVWTKPADITVDTNQPLSNMGNVHQGGFHVMMADGAVKFIADSIDPSLFEGLLTHANGESIRIP